MAMRLIHIGVGGRGAWPIRMVPNRDDFESVALVDIDDGNMKAAQEVSGLPDSVCFRELKDALENVEADAVVVITPPDLHAEMCLEAVRAGKHVLVEKPFTKTLADARQVVEEAESRGVVVAVCQNARYSATTVTVSRLIREEVYGKASFGLFTKFGFRPGTKHSGHDRHSYLWERGIHDLDSIRFMFNDFPRRIWSHSFNPPWSPYKGGATAHAWVEFEGGATCGYLCSFMSHKSGSSLRIDLEGGTLEVVGRELHLRRPEAKEDEVVPLDDAPEATTVLLDGFYRYATEGVQPDFGGPRNLTTVALVEGMGVASDRGAVLDFDSILEDAGIRTGWVR